jgi:hypothetical protein
VCSALLPASPVPDKHLLKRQRVVLLPAPALPCVLLQALSSCGTLPMQSHGVLSLVLPSCGVPPLVLPSYSTLPHAQSSCVTLFLPPCGALPLPSHGVLLQALSSSGALPPALSLSSCGTLPLVLPSCVNLHGERIPLCDVGATADVRRW